VIIPEKIYVKDIYSGDCKRANTMFKLSYQAFIMFGMTMAYVITKFLFYARKTSQRVFGIITGILLVSTFGYFDNATKAWFGDYSFITTFGEVTEKDVDFALNSVYTGIGILFFISVLYVFVEGRKNKKTEYAMTAIAMACMLIVCILFSEFFTVSDKYKHLNSGLYLMDENFEDYEATCWINDNIEGRPVMLEANGNSYTYYERVSTITGLPTILGWRTHEWLWQSTSAEGGLPKIVGEREVDIETIFTSNDIDEVKRLIDKYKVEYIYIGKCEREKFSENLNYLGLLSLGEVCYPNDFISPYATNTFIIKIK